MAAPRPLPANPPGLLDDEDPGKWEKLKQVLWESNLNAPVRGVYNLMNTPYDVLMGGQSPEFDQAVADSFDAAGGISVGSAVAPKPSNALNMGIKAYHGSPHSFDKFSMDKIGTGEGAQAYGHGLYFAENENIAASYRDSLSPGTKYKGGSRYQVQDGTAEGSAVNAVMDLVTEGMRPADAMAAIKRRYVDAANNMDPALFEQGSLATRAANANRYRGYMEIADAVDALNADDFVHVPGSMYEVEINADPNAFLDWDKPLSEQHPAIRPALDKVIADHGIRTSGVAPNGKEWALNGGEIYDRIATVQGGVGGHRNLATQYLKEEAGIPGIKYLDAGSRGAGDGTRNYVVFDDSLIDIIKKYGIAGLLGGGGLYGMSGDEAQAGAY